jgi:isorenieratene synthase
MDRRSFLQGLLASAGAGALGTGCSVAANDVDDSIPEAARAFAAMNTAVPDASFEAERILPFNPFDPVRLPRGRNRSVLVVGGGIAGLAAALELAERGYKVTLKEAAPYLGGRLHTRTETLRTGTFRVEHGLHMWFHQYYNFYDILARLDLLKNFKPFEEVYFKFRTYQDEVIRSVGPYPFNLINIIQESPNLNLLDAAKTFGAVGDIIFYNHATNYRRFDQLSFEDWGRRTGVDKKFWDIIMYPAASVTLNDPAKLSAAEMLLYMHFYFIGHPRAFRRIVTTTDHGTAVIDPWADRLRALGVDIQMGAPVGGLRVTGGRVVGEVNGANYDHVILATDVPGTKKIVDASIATDRASTTALTTLKSRLGALAIAPHYEVLRVWLDKPTRPRPAREAVIETSQYRPINLVALFHMLEDESAEWAKRTGGSIIELHLYNTPELKGLGADAIWARVESTVHEILPELEGARPLDFSLGSYDNFTSFEVGQGEGRPTAIYPKLIGLGGLALAGDWVHTHSPTALMERAVTSGREAANHVLLSDRVRQTVVFAAKSRGPGILPRF